MTGSHTNRGVGGDIMRQPVCVGPGVELILTLFGSLCLQAGHAAAGDADLYAPKVWGSFSGGDMNCSSFVFRDWNGNGLYDLGDRPLANVAVEMTSASRSALIRRTNISGFANFAMSVLQRDRDITEPGRYDFRVIPPPGYETTTGNTFQNTQIRLLPGAPGDMIAQQTLDPVGLAPTLSIRGSMSGASEPDGRIEVTASGPDGRKHQVPLDERGGFEIPASRGTWLIEAVDTKTGMSTETSVAVDRSPVILSAIDPERRNRLVPPDVQIVDFDDLVESDAVLKLPSGHAGVNWHNWVVTHNRFYDGEGYVNGTLSGAFVAYNGSGHPAVIESAEPFDFVGGHFASAWAGAEGEMLHIKGWRGDAVVYEDRLALSAMTPVYFAAAYTGLTRLEFSTHNFWQFVSDDIILGAR